MPIDVSTLDGILSAYYEIVSIPKGGQRRWEDDKYIHSKDPLIMLPIGPNGDLVRLSLDEYHHRRPRIAEESFFEREIHRVTERFGNIAHVWSTYEWDRGPNSPDRGRGINSIQLYYAEDRWWVSSWFFVSESESNPIPTQYLPPARI